MKYAHLLAALLLLPNCATRKCNDGSGAASPANAPISADAPAQPEQQPAPEAGRMAFKQCSTEHRPEMCTKEYRPVCGEVDTGVRCIKAPCPSSERRDFGNACEACANVKTLGYWPVACENVGKDTAP